MRLVLMGTPALAVAGFSALVEAGHEIAAVFTQPDKESGRGRKVQPCPVAAWAKEQNLPLFQPTTFRGSPTRSTLRSIAPDAYVVTAYGRILPRGVLMIPRYGAVNLHGSLLPRWRGASPIQSAIAAGDTSTGLTTMLMDEGLDTGPILRTWEMELGDSDTAHTIGRAMAQASGPLLVDTLAGLEDGSLQPRPQPHQGVTLAPILTKENGTRSWNEAAESLERLIRAYVGWPSVTLPVFEQRIKVHSGRVWHHGVVDQAPGTVLSMEDQGVQVACAQGVLHLGEVQAPGKRVMPARSWAQGARVTPGTVLV